MAQSLELNIKTTNDVPQAMDKAKAATASFGKQVEDIQKKFSTVFKDAVLSFAGPLVLINRIVADIDASIQKTRDNMRKGLEDIASGENKVATQQEKAMARFISEQKKMTQAEAETAAGREAIAGEYVDKNQLDFLINKPVSFFAALMGELGIGKGFGYGFVQEAAAERFNVNNPQAIKAQAEADAKAAEELANKQKAATLKGPELSGNVIGVGANPQLLAQMEANDKLASIDSKLGELVASGVNRDPTKKSGRERDPGLPR